MVITSISNFTAARLVGATTSDKVTDTMIYNLLSIITVLVGFFILLFMKDNKPLDQG
jgi:hypothetical protein